MDEDEIDNPFHEKQNEDLYDVYNMFEGLEACDDGKYDDSDDEEEMKMKTNTNARKNRNLKQNQKNHKKRIGKVNLAKERIINQTIKMRINHDQT